MGSQKQLADGVLAVVGNQTILNSSVMEESFFVAQQKGLSPDKNPVEFREVFNSVLREKIHRAIIVSAAEKDTSIVVSYDDIDLTLNERIEYFVSQVGSIENLEKEMGFSLDEIKSRFWGEIKNEILITGFQRSLFGGIYVTRKEVVDFYENNKEAIPKTPSLSSFSLIENKIKSSLETDSLVYFKTFALRDSLLSGLLDFSEVAKKRSADPSAKTNFGKMTTERGDLVSEYEKAAFSLSLEEISLPIKTSYGYHLIKLLDRVGERITSQHILLTVLPSPADLQKISSFMDSLLVETKNDPGLFDSLAVEYKNKNGGFSGVYNKVDIAKFPEVLSSSFISLENFSFSDVFYDSDSYYVLYRYSFEDEKESSLENNWLLIENLALENKRSQLFNKWIDSQYDKTYVKINSFY